MLCDQAPDTINSESLPTALHQPLATPILPQQNRPVVNTQGRDQPCAPLPMALVFPPYPAGPATGTHSRVLSRVFSTRPTRSCEEQDQPCGNRHAV